jgi:hypothetical protein
MSIISRLRLLEKVIVKETPKPWLTYVQTPGATDEEQREAAIAEYKAKHPDWIGDDFNFIIVSSEECKRLLEQLLNDEGPG